MGTSKYSGQVKNLIQFLLNSVAKYLYKSVGMGASLKILGQLEMFGQLAPFVVTAETKP